MEASGVVFRPQPCYSDTLCRRDSFPSVGFNPRKEESGFRENGHLQYYKSVRCEGKKKDREEVIVKKKLKLVKGMSKDLLMYSTMRLVDDGFVAQKAKLSEATEILLTQLKQLKTEKKEIKRKKKEEKAKLKGSKMKSMKENDDSSSSSSSESSDSECERVVDMKNFRNSAFEESKLNELSTRADTEELLEASSSGRKEVRKDNISNQRISVGPSERQDFKVDTLSSEIQAILANQNPLSGEGVEDQRVVDSRKEWCSRKPSGNQESASRRARIDVCMGGKCKRMGAAALKDELERRVGVEGAVVGCKCMGKCKSAPNVRVSTEVVQEAEKSIRPATNPLYIGVGLEDTNAIAAYFLGEESMNVSVMAA